MDIALYIASYGLSLFGRKRPGRGSFLGRIVGKGKIAAIHAFSFSEISVQIDLRGLDGGVPEILLDHAEIA